jgi:hypothetical protein
MPVRSGSGAGMTGAESADKLTDSSSVVATSAAGAGNGTVADGAGVRAGGAHTSALDAETAHGATFVGASGHMDAGVEADSDVLLFDSVEEREDLVGKSGPGGDGAPCVCTVTIDGKVEEPATDGA